MIGNTNIINNSQILKIIDKNPTIMKTGIHQEMERILKLCTICQELRGSKALYFKLKVCHAGLRIQCNYLFFNIFHDEHN